MIVRWGWGGGVVVVAGAAAGIGPPKSLVKHVHLFTVMVDV